MIQDERMTAPLLRRRAGERLKRLAGGEVFGFSVRAANDRHFYGQAFGTGHLHRAASAFEGHEMLGGAIHERQPGGWSLYRPLRVHSNRFAFLDEDQDPEIVPHTEAYRGFYKPNEINDQLRSLLYDVDGSFLGFIAITRRERSFNEATRSVANRAIPSVIDDFRLAWSLEQAERLENSAHLIVDERGVVRFGGEAATTWLTDRRREAIERRVGRLARFLIDDVLFCGCRLEPFGDWYLSLTPVRGLGRSPLASLSVTQRSIVDLAEKGMTNPEIAHVVGVSVSTVKYHLRALYEALDVASRVELTSVLASENPVARSHAP